MATEDEKVPAQPINPEQPPAVQQPSSTGTALQVVDFGDDAGKGLENVTSEERTLPFIQVLQKGSPQVDPTHADYQTKKIKGARPGMLLKKNTNEVFNVMRDEEGSVPLTVVLAHRDHNFVEYWPRPEKNMPPPQGQGFVGIRSPDDPLVLKLLAEQGRFKKLRTPEGTDLTDTWYLYMIFIAQLGQGLPPYVFPGVTGFSSTQIPYYKSTMDIVTNIRYETAKGIVSPPIWAHTWDFSTFPDSNKKSREAGGGFFSYKLALQNGATTGNPRAALMKMDNPYYLMAKDLYEAVKGGKAKVDHAQNDVVDEQAGGGAGGGGGGGGPGTSEKDIPF